MGLGTEASQYLCTRLRLQRTPSVGVQPGANRAVLRSAPRLHHSQETPRLGRRGCVAGVARCWTSDSRSQRAHQAVATHIARARKLPVVHLDVFWWSEDRDT